MDLEKYRFAPTHEWVRVEEQPGGTQVATVGISDFAVEALTDLVYIALPTLGRQVKAGESFSEIESVKAVSDIYSPVSGEVVEGNTALPDALEILNSDPFGAGWVARIKLSAPVDSGLMDHAAYQKMCQEEGH